VFNILKVKRPAILALSIILLAGTLAMCLLIFNLDIRDAVRTKVLSTTKEVKAVFLGIKKTTPILAYHGVGTDYSWGGKRYFVSPAEFENQVKYLSDNGYTAITINQLDSIKSVDKPVILTFDDGYEDVYTYAYPILKKYGMHASIFIISDFIGKGHYLTTNQILSMMDVFDIESHTKTHPSLAKIDKDTVNYELSQSKADIKKLIGKPVCAIAYPNSSFDIYVTKTASKYYKYGLMNWGGKYYGFENPLRIPRIPIYWDDDINEFKQKIKN